MNTLFLLQNNFKYNLKNVLISQQSDLRASPNELFWMGQDNNSSDLLVSDLYFCCSKNLMSFTVIFLNFILVINYS